MTVMIQIIEEVLKALLDPKLGSLMKQISMTAETIKKRQPKRCKKKRMNKSLKFSNNKHG